MKQSSTPQAAARQPVAQRYDASAIRILAGLEPVRMRPAMYMGSTGPEGLHRMVLEVVENGIDEALAGHCTRVRVTLHDDGSCTVEDDGRGIPVDPHPTDGRPGATVVLTTLHAGAKFGPGIYRVSGGLHGVGISCVNALSSWLELEVHRDGGRWRQRFRQGRPEADLERVGDSDRHGTRIRFRPDPTIFEVDRLSYDALHERVQELAFLNPGVELEIRDERDGRSDRFRYDGGIESFVIHLNRQRGALHTRPFRVKGEAGGVQVDAALQWTALYDLDLRSFVNAIGTVAGGTHVEGLLDALVGAAEDFAREAGLLSEAGFLSIDDLGEGLTCALAVELASPRFEGQAKTRLTNQEVRGAVAELARRQLLEAFRADPRGATKVIRKALDAARVRQAVDRARERSRRRARLGAPTDDDYRVQFGIRSRNWHASAAWITHEGLLSRIAAACRVPPDSRLLDVCCGSGVVGAAFRGRVASLTGLDITPEMVELARERLDEVIEGTVFDMPFEDASFDIVCNREVMHLMPEPERMLREVFRVLRPGGQFVFAQIVPYGADDAPWMYRVFRKKQPLLHHMFLVEDLDRLLLDAGFEGIEHDELRVWESIDVWIDTWETTPVHRQEIRQLYYDAPADVRRVHPFEVLPNGRIRDAWRWVVFSCFKPGGDR